MFVVCTQGASMQSYSGVSVLPKGNMPRKECMNAAVLMCAVYLGICVLIDSWFDEGFTGVKTKAEMIYPF